MLTSSNVATVEDQYLPHDTVQCIVFHPDPNIPLFALASWDCRVSIFQVKSNPSTLPISSPKFSISHLLTVCAEVPSLDLRWMIGEKDTLVITGGDGAVSLLKCSSQQIIKVAQTESLLFANIIMIESQPVVLTVSQSKKIRYWTLQSQQPLKEQELRHAPLCADNNHIGLVVVLNENYIAFVKFTDIGEVTHLCLNLDIVANNISLSSQTLDFVIGTVDGRLLVGEVVVNGTHRTLNRKIAFKAHKSEDSYTYKKKALYLVNSVGFTDEIRSERNLVYSAGNEGTFKLWDLKKRETIFDLSFTESKKIISCSAMSPDKKMVAIAFGYDWSLGVWGLKKELTPISIIVQPVI